MYQSNKVGFNKDRDKPEGVVRRDVQGYLAHKKTPTPLGTAQGHRHRPTVGFYGEAFSYERGTPVRALAFTSVACLVNDVCLTQNNGYSRSNPLSV